MIVREREPINLEMPFATLDSFLVPTERFYVRNHFARRRSTPRRGDSASKGRRDAARTHARRCQETAADDAAVALECAGNGRVYLTPKVRGVAWQQGAVGNAEWTGVSLHDLLERAGVKKQAVEVSSRGPTPGASTTTRSRPARSAMPAACRSSSVSSPARASRHAMNGAPLTPTTASRCGHRRRVVRHGVGEVADAVGRGDDAVPRLWQTFDYSYHLREADQPVMQAIGEMRVKSSIARPAGGDVLKAGVKQRLFGAAWAGEADVAKVEVSSDGGATWTPAKLLEPASRYAWRLWEADWTPTTPGRYALMSRATDSQGQTQPMTRDPDLRTYMIHHVVPVEVEVK